LANQLLANSETAITAAIYAFKVPMAVNHDSAPIIGYFSDRDIAEQCLRQLRNSGILNEQIGVSNLGDTVITPANDPSVYRVVDQGNSTSDIQDYTHRDDMYAPRTSAYRIPVDPKFREEGEAKEYEHPQQGVMVSVSIEPTRREEVRNMLLHFGARLSDWASNDKVA
jgi:hypothetical protein